MDSWTHRYTATRPYPGADFGPGRTITVTAGLQHLSGNARPYFSVIAEIGRPGARDIDAGGRLHTEVLASFPDLAPVVALHLSDDNGVPIYAEENGWHWLAGALGGVGERYHGGNGTPARTPDECLALFAAHCRISMEQATDIADNMAAWRDTGLGAANLRAAWGLECNAMKPRWQDEARAAVWLLDVLIAGGRDHVTNTDETAVCPRCGETFHAPAGHDPLKHHLDYCQRPND